jgi:SAM-dependent methyltransferase
MQSVSDTIRSAGIASIPWIPPGTTVRSPSLGLRCPECRELLIALSHRSLARENSSAHCTRCGGAFEQVHGIWQSLPESRHAHLAQFIEAFELAGQDVGKGSSESDFYLALPFRDLTQTETRRWAIRAKTFRFLQEEVLSELAGEGDPPLTILDLGAGNGWMSYRLARLGHRPVAVDLLTNSRNGLGAASHFRSELPELFPRFQAEFNNLPFADGQFDCAIFNASFQFSEDFDQTIAEAVRCLRPGGVLIIADSPTYSVETTMSRSQERTGARDPKEPGLSKEGLAGREYLTPQRLNALEVRHNFEWSAHRYWCGFRWACRTWLAKWREGGEPPQYILYSAQVKTR